MEKSIEDRKFILKARLSIMRYLVINAFLVFVNWSTSPQYWWVFWVIAGWGIGLSLGLISRYWEYKMEKE